MRLKDVRISQGMKILIVVMLKDEREKRERERERERYEESVEWADFPRH